MSGVLISSDVFAQQKLASGSVHGCTLPDRLFAKKLTVKGFSEPTRTSVVPYRSGFAGISKREPDAIVLCVRECFAPKGG